MEAPADQPVSGRRWPYVAALLVLFGLLSIQYALKVQDGQSEGHTRSAVTRWQEQVLHVFDRDIYQAYQYPNPPIMALFLYGLAKLPPLAEGLCWFYLKAAMTVLAIYWTFRLVEGDGQRFPRWAQALAVLLSLRPIMGDFLHGNINLFILFLVVAGLYAQSRRHDGLCGALLGLAIACKVTPLLFVPYFAWKRRWTVLGGCAAGLLLSLIVVPGLVLGAEHNQKLFVSWYRQMVEPFVVQGKVTSEHPNQSLPGVVYRLLSDSPSFSTEYGVPERYDNFLHLDPATVRVCLKACMAAFVALVLWSCRTPRGVRRGWRISAEFGVVLVGMLLFSERTWKHHCVTLLVPFAVLSYYLAVFARSRGMRAYLIATLAGAALFMASTSTTLVRGSEPDWAKMAQVYGAYVWANLLILVALVVVLRRRTRGEAVGGRISVGPSMAA